MYVYRPGGGRTDTRWLTLTDAQGKGLKITAATTVDFSVQHYTVKDLWQVRYGHDLPDIRRAEVVLNLDCVQRGLGNASCGPGPRPQYEIKRIQSTITLCGWNHVEERNNCSFSIISCLSIENLLFIGKQLIYCFCGSE